MAVFRSIVFAAVLSGLLVGSFATIAQRIATVPLGLAGHFYRRFSRETDLRPVHLPSS